MQTLKQSQNVCYIKHLSLFLHTINNIYGQEYIRKNDAKGFESATETDGRADYDGPQAQASVYAGYRRESDSDTSNRFEG